MTLDMAELWLELIDGVTKENETKSSLYIDVQMKNWG